MECAEVVTPLSSDWTTDHSGAMVGVKVTGGAMVGVKVTGGAMVGKWCIWCEGGRPFWTGGHGQHHYQ